MQATGFRTYDLAVTFYHASIKLRLPAHLKNQFDRAASSIVLNLAEGNAKPTAADRRCFYRRSLGSLREIQAILALQPNEHLYGLADRLGGHLYKLCRSLEP